VIRIAAVGDVHFGTDSVGSLREPLESLRERADVLLLAGDLTANGKLDEGIALARELGGLGLPMVAVLGNHDYHFEEQDRIRTIVEEAGVVVLEGEATSLDVNGETLGIAGVKGFGGGFSVGASWGEFGEPQMKAFIRHTRESAEGLRAALDGLTTERRIALLHYSPIEATVKGEALLAEAIDDAGAELVVHGHAHHGSEKGVTPGGIQVRNVAQPVIRRAYSLFEVGAGASVGA
jgi:Icc-related predicted phosphoesterase